MSGSDAPPPEVNPDVPLAPQVVATPSSHKDHALSRLILGLALGLVVGVLGTVLVTSVISSRTVSAALASAVEACDTPEGLSVSDGGRTLTFDMEGEEEFTGAAVDDIVCVLVKLDVPDAVVANMDQTTAMDGRQSSEWDEFEVTWSYHPDRGLDGVITVAQP